MAKPIAVAFVELKLKAGKYKAQMGELKRTHKLFAHLALTGLNKVEDAFRRIGRTAGRVGKRIKSALDKPIKSLSLLKIAAIAAAIAIAVKLTKALIRAGRASIVSAVRLDKLRIGLKAVAGGSIEAALQMSRLEQVSKLPGLSFEGAIAGSTALQAAGLSARLSERSLLAFGNALVTVGKGAHELDGVNLALTQIITKGRGFGQELRQLAERLPQIRQAMKSAFGVSSVEDFQKLGLTANQFIEGIVTEFEKLPKVTGTVANSLENLGIAFDRLKASIGKTMLDVTRDTAESLTTIIDKVRDVIDHYKLFRDEARTVLLNVALTGVRVTTAMLQGMGQLIFIAGKVLWKPLLFGAIDVFQQVEAELGKLGVKAQKFFGIIDEARAEELIAGIEKATKENTKFARSLANMELQDALRKEMPAIEEAIRSAFTAGTTGVADMNAELDTLKKRIQFMKGLKTLGLELAKFFKDIFKPPDITAATLALGELSKETLEQLKVIGERNKLAEKLYQKDVEAIRKAMLEKVAFTMKEESALADWLDGKRRDRLKKDKEALELFREQVVDFVAPIKRTFEDLFVGLISDDKKRAFKQFWDDLKRIVIRALAEMVAAQIAAAIATAAISAATGAPGGGSGGFGSFLTAIGPSGTALKPLADAVGAGLSFLGKKGSKAGKFLEGTPMAKGGIVRKPTFALLGEAGTEVVIPAKDIRRSGTGGRDIVIQNVNFIETDFANMDRARLQKDVIQQIMPIVQQAVADGIGG